MADKRFLVDLDREQQPQKNTQFEVNTPTFDGHESRDATDRFVMLSGTVETYAFISDFDVEVTTRADLLALATAGNLDMMKTYAFPVTQATGNGSIYIKPVDVDKLGSSCHWHDPAICGLNAWPAHFAVSGDEMQMLHDPVLNNTVYEETSINGFPWGNTSVTHMDVKGGFLIYTAGVISHTEISSLAEVFVNGGNTQRCTISGDAVVTIDSGDFRENVVRSGAVVTQSSTGDVDSNTFEHNSNTTVSGAGNLDTSHIKSDATLNITGGTAINCTFGAVSIATISGGSLADSTIGEDCDITIISSTNYENTFGRSTVYTQVGTGYIRYSQIEGTSTWINGDTNVSNVQANSSTVNTTGSTGTISSSIFSRFLAADMQNVADLTITDCEMTSYATFTVNDAARVYAYRSSYSGYSRVLTTGAVRLDMSHCCGESYGYFQVTAGDLRCTGAKVGSYGYIRHDSTGANLVQRSSATDNGYIRFAETATGSRVYYSQASGGGRIYIFGTTVDAYIYYCSSIGYGRIYADNTVGARIYYSTASGNGYLFSSGNTGRHYIYYCHADGNGQIIAINNSAPVRIYGCHADSQGIIRLQNTAAAGRLYYSSAHAYYYMYITKTTTSTTSALHGYGRRTNTITDPANGTFTENF